MRERDNSHSYNIDNEYLNLSKFCFIMSKILLKFCNNCFVHIIIQCFSMDVGLARTDRPAWVRTLYEPTGESDPNPELYRTLSEPGSQAGEPEFIDFVHFSKTSIVTRHCSWCSKLEFFIWKHLIMNLSMYTVIL